MKSAMAKIVIPGAVLAGLVLIVAAVGPSRLGLRKSAEPKNVLLLFIDTLRADRMGLYGHERANTPQLEQFAATAAVFQRAYSPTSTTRNSFASYFTGLYPETHRCEGKMAVLTGNHRTLAELFKAKGYATAGIYANFNISKSFGFDQGFDLYEHPEPNAGYRFDYQYTDAAAMTDRIKQWLRDERPQEKPWFLFVLYIDPHDPYLGHSEQDIGEAPYPGVDGSRRFLEKRFPGQDEQKQAAAIDYVRKLYEGEIAYVDRHVGEVLAVLDEEGLTDDTVVIVSADHGEGLWDHQNYRGHGMQVFEEQIHVPLIVRWPGRSRPGSRIAHAVEALDLFGALAEAFDLALPHEYQAGSLLGALSGRPGPRTVYVAQRRRGVGLRAYIDWPWKLLQDDHDQRPYLYNLAEDPLESVDLAEIDETRTFRMLGELESITEANYDRRGEFESADEIPILSQEEKRELRALGYVW